MRLLLLIFNCRLPRRGYGIPSVEARPCVCRSTHLWCSLLSLLWTERSCSKRVSSVEGQANSAGNGNGSERPRGYFIGAVHGIILELGHDFTSRDIETKIAAKGIEVLAANPNIAINETLATLEKRGQV